MPTILFRADSEKTIGTGDLLSSIYLSRLFRRNSWECLFIVKDYEPAVKIIRQHNLKNARLIPSAISIKDEIRVIKETCRTQAVDCLFMQITKNSLRDYKDLGKPVPIKVCMNFDGIITDDFDIVINWCVDSSDDIYKAYKEKGIQFILGFENTVLPDYFGRNAIPVKLSGEEAGKMLVFMGGIDEFDMTGTIVRAINEEDRQYEVRIIIGPGYHNENKLFQSMNERFKKNTTIKKSAESLLDDYRWADIAFSAGGLTSSELIAAKIPTVLVATHEHQLKRCKYYAARHWAHYAGYYSEFDEDRIRNGLNYLLRHINLFRGELLKVNFIGGNKKIYRCVNSRILSRRQEQNARRR